MIRRRSETEATHRTATSIAADPDGGEGDVRQGHRDDEAQRLEQLLPDVVLESGRRRGEGVELCGDRLDDPRMVVSQKRARAARRQVQVATVLVIPDIRTLAPDQPQRTRRAMQLIEPPIRKNRGHRAPPPQPLCRLAYSRHDPCARRFTADGLVKYSPFDPQASCDAFAMLGGKRTSRGAGVRGSAGPVVLSSGLTRRSRPGVPGR